MTILMRFRLIHTLTLLLASSAFLAVLSMGAVNAWNLRNGFSEYLLAGDIERLDELTSDVANIVDKSGGIEGLVASKLSLDDILRLLGDIKAQPPGGQTLPDMNMTEIMNRKMGRSLLDGPDTSSPMPRGSTRDSEDFTKRIAIYRTNGQLLLKHDIPRINGAYIERPILILGSPVAFIRMTTRRSQPRSPESDFLRAQLASIFFVACAFFLLALFSAKKIAGYWVRPLLEIQLATERIAHGELGVRLNESRSDEIGDAMRNINRMAHGLQRLDSNRRQWIADISHELRTPLSVLRGEIDALIDGVRPLTPKAVFSLREEVLQLGSLVDDLHLLAMSDLKALPCYFQDCNAEKLLEKVTQRFNLRAAHKGLALQFQVTGPTPILVNWDSRRIEQLLNNLLENSLRYTDSPGQVRVQLTACADHVAIDIEDSAPGVPEEHLLRLFEPLYRVDADRNRDSGGSGLGLAICRAIVQSHRGAIDARAASLGGLLIHVELPWSAEESQ